jgi:hypothetical protein
MPNQHHGLMLIALHQPATLTDIPFRVGLQSGPAKHRPGFNVFTSSRFLTQNGKYAMSMIKKRTRRNLTAGLRQTACLAFACFAMSGPAAAEQVSLTDNLVAKLKSKSAAITSKLSPGAGYTLGNITFSGNFDSSGITFLNRAVSLKSITGTTAWGAACTPGDYTITGTVEVSLEAGETFESSKTTTEDLTVTVNATAGTAFASASITTVADLSTTESSKNTTVNNTKTITSSSSGLNRQVTCANGQPQFFQMIGSAAQQNWYNGAYSPPDFSKPIPYTYDVYPAAGSQFAAKFTKPGSTQPGQNLAVHFYDKNRNLLWTGNYDANCSSAQNCNYFQANSSNTPDFFGNKIRESARYVNVSTSAGKDRVDVLICKDTGGACYSADDQGTDVMNAIPSGYVNTNLVTMQVRNFSNNVVNAVTTSVTGTVVDFVSVAEATTQFSGEYTAASMDGLQTAYSFTQMPYQNVTDATKALCPDAEANWLYYCPAPAAAGATVTSSVAAPSINLPRAIVLSPK